MSDAVLLIIAIVGTTVAPMSAMTMSSLSPSFSISAEA
jgi:Mn2+/Fe2+ NRAMP family transporter